MDSCVARKYYVNMHDVIFFCCRIIHLGQLCMCRPKDMKVIKRFL